MPFVISDIFDPTARQLRSKCSVIDPVTGNSCQASAIWDTGASCSCISPAIAKRLNLPVVSSTTSNTANGTAKAAELGMPYQAVARNVLKAAFA